MGLLQLLTIDTLINKKSSATGTSTPGLTWTAYSGTTGTDVNFSSTYPVYPTTGRSPQGYDPPTNGKSTGITSDLTNLSTGTNGNWVGNGGDGKNHHQFCIEWVGVIYTQSYGGTWTFQTNSDDMSMLWVGDVATSGYTLSNAVVNNQNDHGMVTKSGTISLNANTYYPIRIQFSENGGGYEMITTVTPPGGSAFTNGTGFYFTAKPSATGKTVITNTPGLAWTLWQSYWPNYYSTYSRFPDVPMPTSGTWSDPLNGGTWDACRGVNSGVSSNLATLNAQTNGSIIDNTGNTHHFSVRTKGYLYTQSYEGTWYFTTSSDDASNVWLGPLAQSGATSSNGMVNQRIYLNAYTFYPLLIWYGEYEGGFSCNITCYKPDGTSFTNGDGYYFTTNNALYSYNQGSAGLSWSLWQSYWPNYYNSYSRFPDVPMPTSGTWSDPLNGGTWDACRGVNSGISSDLSTLNSQTNGSIIDNNGNTHHFSVRTKGYLYTGSYQGNWYWSTSSDDASSVWFGPLAQSGATPSNQNGGTSIYALPNTYIPVLIWYGEYEGGYSCRITCYRPDGTSFTNGSGAFFSTVTTTSLSSSSGGTSLNVPGLYWNAYANAYELPNQDDVTFSSNFNSYPMYPLNGVTTVSNPTQNNPSNYNQPAPIKGYNTGVTNDFTSLATCTNGNFINDNNPANNYISIEWKGYFYTKTYSGTFTFYTSSDDASYLWLGTNALDANYNISNPNINNGRSHGMNTVSCTISLNADTYYPIRVTWGQGGGGYNMQMWFNVPGSSTNIYDGTGYYFTGTNTQNFLQSITSVAPLWGAYSAEAWSNNVLTDLTGNGRHATTTGVTKGSSSGNGALGTVTYLNGANASTASAITWPSGSIPNGTFTVASLTRYTGGSRGRILNSTGSLNWLHGHWSGQAGVCHYDGWKSYSTNSSAVTNVDNWLVCVGTNNTNISMPINVIANGFAVATYGNGGSSNATLCINGPYEYSNFQFSQLLIWNTGLSYTQMKLIDTILQNYLNTGTGSIQSLLATSGPSELIPNVLWLDATNSSSYSGSGTTWYDLTSNHNNLTLYNTTFSNGSIVFNGSTSYAYISALTNSTGAWNSSNWTAIAWIYIYSNIGGMIFQYGRSPSDANTEMGWYGNYFWDWMDGLGLGNVYTTTTASTGAWHCHAFVKQTTTSTTGTFYLDGAANGTVTASINAQISNNDFCIGKDYRDNNAYLNGNFGSLKIFNTALTSSQILTEYNVTKTKYFSATYPYWTPLQVSGLQLWLDANDPLNNSTMPAATWNGSVAISTWYDKSGNGRNATAVNSPTFSFMPNPATTTIGSTSYYGGQQCAINFNGTNQYLYGSVPITGSTISVFAVATLTSSSAPGAARIIGFSNGIGTNDFNNTSYFGFLRQGSTGFGPYRNGTYINNNPPNYNTPYLWECWYDGTSAYASVCGGGQVAQQSNSTSNTTGNFAITTYAVAANPNTGDGPGFLTGSISEILVFNTVLSTADRQSIEGYLSWKWGMQSFLPSNHPYYSVPPSGSSSNVDFSKSIPVVVLGSWNQVGTWTGNPGGDTTGYWVWNIGRASSNCAAGPWIHFYKQMTFATAFTGTMWIICDNYSYFFMNSVQQGNSFGGNWNSTGTSVSINVPAGTVLFDIFAVNGGGPGGLIASLYNGSTLVMHTDPSWTFYTTSTAYSNYSLPSNLV